MTNIMGNDVVPTGEVTLPQRPPDTDINRSKDRQAVRSQLPHLSYRRDIDGLRAVAVIAVVLFHAFPRWLVGGYVGVDVFFVISGFLISSILFKSLANGSFTFADFYARRARRIFPALVSMLIPVGLLGWYVLTPDEFSTLGKHIASGGAFVGNITLWLETGYFDTSADVKPLLHLWSLGVEEQFYIVWPIVLCAAWCRRWPLLAVCAAFAAISFSVNIAAIDIHADAVFFLSFTRFWELLAGAGLAYFTVTNPGRNFSSTYVGPKAAALVRNLASLLGTVVLAGAIYMLDKSHAFPGWWALLPVCGATLVIAAGPQALINRFILGNRLMVSIGLISYPLYLWHWPLLAFGRILQGEMSKELRFGLIALAVFLAASTYQFVEKIFRRSHLRVTPKKDRRQLIGLYSAIAACCAVGLAACWGHISSRSDARDVDILLEAQFDRDFPPKTFAKLSATGPNFFTRAGSAPGYTVFIGDSLVEHYGARIEQLMSSTSDPHHSVIFATGPGCPTMPNVFYVAAHTQPACAEVNRQAWQIAQRADVRKVIIGGDWDRDLSHFNPALVYRFGNTSLLLDTPKGVDAAFAALEAQVAELSKTKQVYILLSSPKSGSFSPKSMLNGSRWTTLTRRQGSPMVDISDFVQKNAKARARLVEMAARHRATVIDPILNLCNGTSCRAVSEDGRPYFTDMAHMRPFYVRQKATYLDKAVLAD